MSNDARVFHSSELSFFIELKKIEERRMEGLALSGRTKANVIYTRFKSWNSVSCKLKEERQKKKKKTRRGKKRDEISTWLNKLSGNWVWWIRQVWRNEDKPQLTLAKKKDLEGAVTVLDKIESLEWATVHEAFAYCVRGETFT